LPRLRSQLCQLRIGIFRRHRDQQSETVHDSSGNTNTPQPKSIPSSILPSCRCVYPSPSGDDRPDHTSHERPPCGYGVAPLHLPSPIDNNVNESRFDCDKLPQPARLAKEQALRGRRYAGAKTKNSNSRYVNF
jgi:hypothetical protein